MRDECESRKEALKAKGGQNLGVDGPADKGDFSSVSDDDWLKSTPQSHDISVQFWTPMIKVKGET